MKNTRSYLRQVALNHLGVLVVPNLLVKSFDLLVPQNLRNHFPKSFANYVFLFEILLETILKTILKIISKALQAQHEKLAQTPQNFARIYMPKPHKKTTKNH